MMIGEASRSTLSNRPLIVALALALLTLVTYLPALDNGFVNFDDNTYATASPWVDEGFTIEGVKRAFGHFYGSNWYPLTLLSHMLDNELFGLRPRGHGR